ncbi:MAG: hypothetical protein ACOCUD_01690 [Bacillota bacterium]
MVNGIPYPVSKEFKEVWENKRKDFKKYIKCKKVSQANFTQAMVPYIKNIKFKK